MNIELQSRSASALLDEDEPVPRDAAVHVKIPSRALYLSRPTQDFKFEQNYKLTLKMFNFSYRFGPNVFEFINRSRPTNLICFSHRSRSTTEQDLCIFASAYRSAGEIHFKNNYVYVDLKSDLQ